MKMNLFVNPNRTILKENTDLEEHIESVIRSLRPLASYLGLLPKFKKIDPKKVSSYIRSKQPSLSPTVARSSIPTATPTLSSSPTFSGQTSPPTEQSSESPSAE